jgi:hypothetical protein
MITNMLLAPVLLVAAAVSLGLQDGARGAPQTSAAAEAGAIAILKTALVGEERWIKVHAAEALLAVDWTGSRASVARVFGRELVVHDREPQYRIGVWRVLAQAAASRRERDGWIRKIVAAFLAEGGPDRLHAAETLGKLRYQVRAQERDRFERAARASPDPLAADALWVLANTGDADAERRLAQLFRASDAATRATAAYAVRYLPRLAPSTWDALSAAAAAESADDLARASFAAAAFVHAPADRQATYAAVLAEYARVGTADTKSEALGAYAMAAARADDAAVRALLRDANADVRVAAARALVAIARRPLTAR